MVRGAGLACEEEDGEQAEQSSNEAPHIEGILGCGTRALLSCRCGWRRQTYRAKSAVMQEFLLGQSRQR